MKKNTPRDETADRAKFICIAPGCTNNSLNTKDVGFHSFPVTQRLAELWLNALGRERLPSRSRETVCSKHFQKEDFLEDIFFINRNSKNRILKPDAVPFVCPSRQTVKEQGEDDPSEDGEDEDEDDTSSESKSHRSRFSKALGDSTKMFMDVLNSSPNGVMELSEAARVLQVSKRRIYDIIHVLEGISLVKKTSKNTVKWVGWPEEFRDDRLTSMLFEEKKLDGLIRSAKQQIQDMYENLLNYRLAYLTYEDIQSLSVFEDQTVFVIKAPPETKVEVAHPKEAFQIHIDSKTGPVEVLACTDNLDISDHRRGPMFDAGDYSYVPLQGLSTASVSKDNDNHNKTKNKTTSNSRQEPLLPLSQPPNMSPKNTSVPPLPEDQFPPSVPSAPVAPSIKEEISIMNITPDEPMDSPALKPDQMTTDVHMTDLVS